MASSQQHRCVFVGNIPYDATEEQLIQICEEVGPVVSFRLVIDRETGKPKGYGFCEYKDEETALSARRNLQGYEINGRQLRVDFAENDKGSDRNRDQGRGGPGMATNVDGQKQIGGPAVIGDSTLHQPIGIPIAMSAASVMAGALGGAQSSQINQNGFQNPVGNDPLTHHLAKMSKSQLNQVMHEMKMLATQNKDVARQLLLGSPQLTKALFQVQIMLGLVTPQMLQMPNIRAQAPNPSPQPSLQLPMQGQQPIAPQTVPGLPPFASLTSVSQSSLLHGQFSTPLPLPPQPRAQLPNLSQIQPPLQSTMPAQSGPPPLTALRPQPMAGPQIPAVSSHSFSPLQPSLVQHGGHPGQLPIPSSSLLPSFQSRPISSDPMYQAASSVRPGLVEANNRDTAKNAQVMGDTALVGRAQGTANLPQVSNKNDSQNLMARPAKLVKLDDGRAAHFSSAGPTVMESGPSNAVKNSSIGVGQNSITEAQALDKQGPQLQLPPDVESALLQQVLNLTPEQLSSLPPEQQQQVVQLQKMLR